MCLQLQNKENMTCNKKKGKGEKKEYAITKSKEFKRRQGRNVEPINNKLTHRCHPLKKENRKKGEEQEGRINKRSIEQKHTKKYTYFLIVHLHISYLLH